ncbi:MAG: MFS transporter [Ahniella sp.]|nr:MFS transporter [Ahniella sp.]
MAEAPSRHIQHPVALAALLSLLAMFGPFTIDAFFPAFSAVAADLDANQVEMQQTISLYLIGYALMALVHGPLSDRFGRRPVILFGVVAYALASLGCALSASIESLWLFRFCRAARRAPGSSSDVRSCVTCIRARMPSGFWRSPRCSSVSPPPWHPRLVRPCSISPAGRPCSTCWCCMGWACGCCVPWCCRSRTRRNGACG